MTRRVLFGLLIVLVLLGCGVSLAAPPLNGRPAGLSPDYRGEQDGPVFMAVDPGGRLWAAWSYAQGGEFDVAVSVSEGRVWTFPVLLGEANGRNDVDPRIAFLADGTPVVAWWQEATEGSTARVLHSAGTAAGGFSQPVVTRSESTRPSILATSEAGFTVGSVSIDGGVTIDDIDVTPPRQSIRRGRERASPDGGTNGPDPMPTFIIRPPNGEPPTPKY